MHPWLSRLRHDLVKRAVWPARDLRDATREPAAADLLHLQGGLLDLRDQDGRELTAAELWDQLRAEAPGLPPGVLDAFGGAVAEASARCRRSLGTRAAGAARSTPCSESRPLLPIWHEAWNGRS